MFEGDVIHSDSADHGPASSEFFELRVATRSSPIRIEYSAIRALHSVVSGENRSVGLLLGTFSLEGVVSVDDCELLPWDSATADTFFKARMEYPAQRVVGFFRTQPAGWPEMQDVDLEIARGCFQHPGSLFLLIQTPGRRPWSAAFFDLAAERAFPSKAPALEFFFDEYLLRNGYSTALVPMPEQQQPLQDLPLRRRRTPWIALGTLVGLLLLSAGGYTWWFAKNRGESASISSATSPLGLKVVRSGKDFEVSWDRPGPALQQVSGGILTIKDGELSRSVTLNAKQLQEGRILYSPLFGDLMFRLEIRQGARAQAESVQVLSWDATPPPDLATPLDLPTPAGLPTPPGLPGNAESIRNAPSVNPRPVLSETPHGPLPDRGAADLPSRLAAGKTQPPASVPPSAPARQAMPSPIPPKKASVTPNPPDRAIPAVGPQITPSIVPAKPVAVPPAQLAPNVPSTVQQPEAKIPDHSSEPAGVSSTTTSRTAARSAETPPTPSGPSEPPLAQREQPPPQVNSDPVSKSLTAPVRPQSSDPGYTPPVAVTRATPRLTPEMKRGLEDLHGAHLSVRVTVDTSGNVRNAEILPSSGNAGFVDNLLKSAALDAARRWQFRPGALHGKAIPGDVTIEFNFQ